MPEQAAGWALAWSPCARFGVGRGYLFVSLFSLPVTKQPDPRTASCLSGVKLGMTPLERTKLGKGYWLLAGKSGTGRVAPLPMWVPVRGLGHKACSLNHLGGVQVTSGTH